jgi:hypothetical protein
MSRTYLSACAVFLLLGACSSSTDNATDSSVPPTKIDSGAGGSQTDTFSQVGLDSGAGGSGGTVVPGLDASLDTGTTIKAPVDSGVDVGTSTKVDSGSIDADVALDSGAQPDVNNTLVDAKPDLVPDVNNTVTDAKPDLTPDVIEVDKPTYDGGLGLSCIKGLFGTYVLRWDGILIDETTPTSPQTVFEASTGLPLSGVTSMQQGKYHGCAVLTNGTVECWQTNKSTGNQYGQLGNGTTTVVEALYRATPVLTAASTPLTNAVALAPGHSADSSCAVTGDSKLWCWGNLAWIVNKGTTLATGYAQATTTDGAAPLTGVISAGLGRRQACALVAGTPNTVWCWGWNGDGALGQGDTTTRQYPTKVLGLTNPTVVAVAPNGDNAAVCALEGETVKCWGQNSSGQAGVNVATDPILSPSTVVVQSGSVLDGVSLLVPGGASFATLRSTATMWTWGYGSQKYASNYGQTNVLAIGWAGPSANGNNGPRFLTSDGVYHNDTAIIAVNCNSM